MFVYVIASSSSSLAWAQAQALPSLPGLLNGFLRLWPSFPSSSLPTIQPPHCVPAKPFGEFVN